MFFCTSLSRGLRFEGSRLVHFVVLFKERGSSLSICPRRFLNHRQDFKNPQRVPRHGCSGPAMQHQEWSAALAVLPAGRLPFLSD